MKDVKINIDLIKKTLKEKSLTQKDLASRILVTEQAVSSWLNGTKLPESSNLQKLSSILELNIKDLLFFDKEPTPQFKLPKTTKRKDYHLNVADEITNCLQQLMPIIKQDYLKNPFSLKEPKTDYDYIQQAAQLIRSELNIQNDIINLNGLIDFINSELNTIIVPVIWGQKKSFAEALMIPCDNIYFLYINIDSYNRDNKFWLLHEICHIIAPTIQNDYEKAELFSNSLSNAILFPGEFAELTVYKLMNIDTAQKKIDLLKGLAQKYAINIYSIYKSLEEYLNNNSEYQENILPNIENYYKVENIKSHIKNQSLISISQFLKDSEFDFKTNFYNYLKVFLLNNSDIGPTYVKKLLNISFNDAIELYNELVHG